MENRDRKRLKKKLKATNSLRATNAKKGIQGDAAGGKKGKVMLSMFWDSKKEGPWRMPIGRAKLRSTSRRAMIAIRSRTPCSLPWKVRPAGISSTVISVGI